MKLLAKPPRVTVLSHYIELERLARLMAQEARYRCPYCDRPLPDERAACCGEVGHAARVCERCKGTGCIDAPTSDADPCCPDCDGTGVES